MLIYHTVIIGGGAAGLYAAMELSRRGIEVLILEKESKIASKVLISGGGKCNFTNRSISAENYVSQNPNFVKSALARFTPTDFLKFLNFHKVTWEEREYGRLFTIDGANKIVQALEKEIVQNKGKIFLNIFVKNIEKIFLHENNFLFQITSSQGDIFQTRNVILATGGLTTIKYANELAFSIAPRLGLKTIAPEPGLVPLKISSQKYPGFYELSGISLPVKITCGKKTFCEPLLFTQEGISGPVVLQSSLYWKKGIPFSIDLLPEQDFEKLLQQYKGRHLELKNILANYLPKRLAEKFCQWEFPSQPMQRYNSKQILQLIEKIHHWNLIPEEKADFALAETTIGGISTDELSSKTMEVKKIPGLYCIGEAIDVAGQLGGYNLHIAWASGFAAAVAICEKEVLNKN